MDRILPICDKCPVEKSPNGLCFEGSWSPNEGGGFIFTGTWRCIYYNRELDECNYE